jgi:hypothetical protein
MVLIRVPKTPASAMNPNRPISKLLRNQIEHLQEAEFRLPADKQTNIYINAIKTEGEAAEYIRQVTERIHSAAAPAKPKRKPAKTKTFRIAASASSKRKGKTKSKPKSRAKTKKKRR